MPKEPTVEVQIPQTVSWRSSVLVWDTTPRNCLATAGWRTTLMPATVAVPDVGITLVVSMPAVVVFPAPLGPSSPKISPANTERPIVHCAKVGLCVDLGEMLGDDDWLIGRRAGAVTSVILGMTT